MTTKLPSWMPPKADCHAGCAWLDLAVGLLGLGYAPFPLGAEKVPLVKWGAYHLARPGWRELYNDWLPLWPEACGLGLVTGKPHGLVVVDADDEESWRWALANLPAVRGVKTRRGGHLHFRHAERGIIGNRSGDKAVTAAGVKLDVRGLAGCATAPYSIHPSGITYEPLFDWTMPVGELPLLPDIIRLPAEDHPPVERPRLPVERPRGEPAEALRCYLRKIGGVPAEGQGADVAVFRAAAWARTNRPDLDERAFAAVVREYRPEFQDEWIGRKWRSARGAA